MDKTLHHKDKSTELHYPKEKSVRKIRRKFTKLHLIIYHIKMPSEVHGYIRPRKFDHF